MESAKWRRFRDSALPRIVTGTTIASKIGRFQSQIYVALVGAYTGAILYDVEHNKG